MRHIDQIAALLFADDPKSKAERILSSLVAESDARGGAVLSIRHGRLTLLVGQDLDLAQLSDVHNNWRAAEPTLAAGTVHREGFGMLAPLKDGAELVGVLFLDAPRAFDLADTEILRALLGKAVSPGAIVPQTPIIAAQAEPLPAHEAEKEQLFRALQRDEWNIAVVARKMGVTRRTIYLRMERYGIE